jgi:hypothetical protein
VRRTRVSGRVWSYVTSPVHASRPGTHVGCPEAQPGSTGLILSAESSGSTLQPEVALSTPRLHSSYGKPMSPDGPTLGYRPVPWVDCTVRTTDRIDVALTAILSPNGTRQKFRPVRPRAHHDLAIRIGTVVVAKSFVFRYVFDPHHVASDTGSMNHPYSHILPWRTEEQRLHTVDSPDVIPVERTINPHSQYRSTTYSNQLPRSDRSRTLSVTVRVACHGVRRNRRVFCVSRPVSHVAGLKVVIFSTTTADVKARTQRSGSRDLCLSGSAAEVDLLLMGFNASIT